MSSPEFSSPGSQPYREPPESNADASPRPADPPTSELLEQVLQETLSESAEPSFDPQQQLATLQSLARQYQGQPWEMEPVGRAVVHAILELRLSNQVVPQWDEMVTQVTQTLFDDPQAQERLRQFWARLCASVLS